MVGIMLTDLSAAFDMVSIPILNTKLKLFGMDKRTVDCLSSFLEDRQQVVSQHQTVEQSSTQDSILSLLLYILY